MALKVSVIGAGSWGTALAKVLADNGHEVKMWSATQQHLIDMEAARENVRYLPGVKLPDSIKICLDERECLKDAEMVLFSVPAQKFRTAFQIALAMMPEDAIVVNVAKGIETASLMRLSEIAYSIKPGLKYAILSGPSHAEEVGRGMPTTVTAASKDPELAEFVQDAFMNQYFRIYTNYDIPGVELGGALKNIIALGAGIADGLGYGDNAKAAMMTRGITEMVRLGSKMGADPATFSGLTGVGDLIVTCTSMHSRNRRCGILIGQGKTPDEAVAEVGMVVEGMYTADAAYRLAKKLGVEMPITEGIYNIVRGNISAADAVQALMTRAKKNEKETLTKELL